MSNLPKFNIRESGRELPYYKKQFDSKMVNISKLKTLFFLG